MLIVALLVAQAAAPASKIPDMKPVPGIPSLLESGMPEVPPQLRSRIEQYQNSRSANALDVAADGSQLLIATRFASTNQLHVVEQPMGMRTQVTFGNEPVNSARFVPGDPRALLYLQDVGGGEFHQVFRLDRRTGRSELLTDGKSRHEGLIVSADGTRFAYSGTGRNGKDTDVYVARTAAPRDAQRVTEREGTWQAVELSRDGKRLLVAQFRAIDDSDLHLYDLQTGELRQITPREGKGSVEDAGFSADGKSVYLITDRYSDFNSLYRIDLSRPGAKPEPLAPQIKGDLESLTVAPDGAHLAFATNEEGWSGSGRVNWTGATGWKPRGAGGWATSASRDASVAGTARDVLAFGGVAPATDGTSACERLTSAAVLRSTSRPSSVQASDRTRPLPSMHKSSCSDPPPSGRMGPTGGSSSR